MLRTFLTIGSRSCAFCWQLTVTVLVVYNRRELTYWKKKNKQNSVQFELSYPAVKASEIDKKGID